MLAERDLWASQGRLPVDASSPSQVVEAPLEDLIHDLKGPVGSIRGLISLVLLGRGGTVSAGQRELLEHAQVASDRILDTIARVAPISQVPARVDTPYLESVDLLQVAHAVMARLTYAAAERQITIMSSGIDVALPPVTADASQIARVLENLVQNAIKFSRPDGRIWIEMALVDGAVCCSVHDEGVGIASSALPHIFERRFRAPGQSAACDGSGLGLAICRRIVDSHGGRIWAESVEGQGTTVAFTLPFAA